MTSSIYDMSQQVNGLSTSLTTLMLKLREPDTLTLWKPIVLGIVRTGLFVYALSRLTKGGRQ